MTALPNRLACRAATAAFVLLALLPGSNRAQGASTAAPLATIEAGIDDQAANTQVRSWPMSPDDINSLESKIRMHRREVLLSGFDDQRGRDDLSRIGTPSDPAKPE